MNIHWVYFWSVMAALACFFIGIPLVIALLASAAWGIRALIIKIKPHAVSLRNELNLWMQIAITIVLSGAVAGGAMLCLTYYTATTLLVLAIIALLSVAVSVLDYAIKRKAERIMATRFVPFDVAALALERIRAERDAPLKKPVIGKGDGPSPETPRP